MPFDFAALEAARAARHDFDPTHARHRVAPETKRVTVAFNRTDYAVAKVYDDKERPPALTKHVNLAEHEAEAHAGRLRDAMSDRDVELAMAEGWNYKVVTVKGSHPKGRRQAFVPTRRR
jgi:hypothetical protein